MPVSEMVGPVTAPKSAFLDRPKSPKPFLDRKQSFVSKTVPSTTEDYLASQLRWSTYNVDYSWANQALLPFTYILFITMSTYLAFLYLIFFLIIKMESTSNQDKDKIILTLIFNDLFYQIKDVVNKYALK